MASDCVRTTVVNHPAVRSFGKQMPYCLAMAGIRSGVKR
jgi:hypothetical protein